MTFVNRGFLETLKSFDIPTCLRICAGTDGSVTFLLEIMTKNDVSVETEEQYIVSADEDMAALLGIVPGEYVNHRTVTLLAGGVPYVHALSLAPIERMPASIRQDMMQADIPIGKILRNSGVETRRDFDIIEMDDGQDLFASELVLSRTYRIVHNNTTLMWIRERFPADERWNL
ncbi:MAG: chorismate pyruvate-lyase family protein [Euryarchaeota archaeon]|nr:chorismate pyruvate-lyase family protein [Euryarchaeota archaeon]